jgi:hypothetical protein
VRLPEGPTAGSTAGEHHDDAAPTEHHGPVGEVGNEPVLAVGTIDKDTDPFNVPERIGKAPAGKIGGRRFDPHVGPCGEAPPVNVAEKHHDVAITFSHVSIDLTCSTIH